jgi:hypothetical protein
MQVYLQAQWADGHRGMYAPRPHVYKNNRVPMHGRYSNAHRQPMYTHSTSMYNDGTIESSAYLLQPNFKFISRYKFGVILVKEPGTKFHGLSEKTLCLGSENSLLMHRHPKTKKFLDGPCKRTEIFCATWCICGAWILASCPRLREARRPVAKNHYVLYKQQQKIERIGAESSAQQKCYLG